MLQPRAATPLSAPTTGFGAIGGLAFDSTNPPGVGTLYGTDTVLDELVTIDVATGGATTVGALGFGSVKGLTYDPASDRLLGSDVIANQIIDIDRANGAGILARDTIRRNAGGLVFRL